MTNATVIEDERELITELDEIPDGKDALLVYRGLAVSVRRRGRDRSCTFDDLPGILICTESLHTQLEVVRDINLLADILHQKRAG